MMTNPSLQNTESPSRTKLRKLRATLDGLVSDKFILECKSLLSELLEKNDWPVMHEATEWISKEGLIILSDPGISDMFLQLMMRLNQSGDTDFVSSCLKRILDIQNDTALDRTTREFICLTGISNPSMVEEYWYRAESKLADFASSIPGFVDHRAEAQFTHIVQTLNDMGTLAHALQ